MDTAGRSLDVRDPSRTVRIGNVRHSEGLEHGDAGEEDIGPSVDVAVVDVGDRPPRSSNACNACDQDLCCSSGVSCDVTGNCEGSAEIDDDSAEENSDWGWGCDNKSPRTDSTIRTRFDNDCKSIFSIPSNGMPSIDRIC